ATPHALRVTTFGRGDPHSTQKVRFSATVVRVLSGLETAVTVNLAHVGHDVGTHPRIHNETVSNGVRVEHPHRANGETGMAHGLTPRSTIRDDRGTLGQNESRAVESVSLIRRQ